MKATTTRNKWLKQVYLTRNGAENHKFCGSELTIAGIVDVVNRYTYADELSPKRVCKLCSRSLYTLLIYINSNNNLPSNLSNFQLSINNKLIPTFISRNASRYNSICSSFFNRSSSCLRASFSSKSFNTLIRPLISKNCCKSSSRFSCLWSSLSS